MGDQGTQFKEWCESRGRTPPSDQAVGVINSDMRVGAIFIREHEPRMWVSLSTYLTGRGRMATKTKVKSVDLHTTKARLRATTMRGKK